MSNKIDLANFGSSADVFNYLKLLELDKTPAAKVKRAVLYIRKSRIDKHGTHLSPKKQQEMLEDFARRDGCEIVAVIHDLDETGRNAKRDGFQELRFMVEGGQVDVVLVAFLDRVYRNGFALPQFLNFLDDHHVTLQSVTEKFDTSTFIGRLLLMLLAIIAEWPIWSSSERTRSAKKGRVEEHHSNANYRLGYCNGLCSRCTDPNGLGYCPLYGEQDRARYDGNRIVPVPHPIEKHAVILIVHLYYQGYSFKEIATHMNTHSFMLPDGKSVTFRTKGVPGSYPPGLFNPDSVREIVKSLFYVGYVTYTESAPLDMNDDFHNPSNIRTKKHVRRAPDYITEGLHEKLYPLDVWERNQMLMKSKGTTPTTFGGSRRMPLLSGAKCYECHEAGLDQMGLSITLRGTRNGSGTHIHRCATLFDRHITRPAKIEAGDYAETGLTPIPQTELTALVAKHTKPNLPEALMKPQLEERLAQFTIPEEWYSRIMAYYFTNKGLGEYARKRYNLTQEFERYKSLLKKGAIDEEEFDENTRHVQAELLKLVPEAHPEAAEILPLLKDFGKLWQLLNQEEQRALLGDMLSEYYFDGKGTLRLVKPFAPFKALAV